jgi:hypothetical protein
MALFGRWSLAVVAFACGIVPGCSVLPPSSKDLREKGPQEKNNAADACGDNWGHARNCAYFLIETFTDVDANMGKIDSAFGFANLTAGTLGAVYLKSAKDRTQALEDLGVSVGALTGVRTFLRIDDKRKIVRTGVTAVQCMLDAAQASIDKVANGNSVFDASGFAPPLSFKLQNGQPIHSPRDVIAADLTPANPSPESQLVLSALYEERVNAVTRSWMTARQTARALVGPTCESNSAGCTAAKKLGAGLARIVSDVRMAWSKPVEGIDKLQETQRNLVNEQIGALVKAAHDQREEQTKLEGAAAMVPFGTESMRYASALHDVAPDPEVDAQLLSIYSKCVTPSPPAN